MKQMIEYKLLTGRSRDRKSFGAERYDRIPTNLTEQIILHIPEDYMQFVPDDLPQDFKAKDFAKADEIRDQLLKMGIILKDTREGVKWERA